MKKLLIIISIHLGLSIPTITCGTGFILEAGVDSSPSVGRFTITLTDTFVKTLPPTLQQSLCSDTEPNCTETHRTFISPPLYDSQTKIGRSRPHLHNGILDTIKGISICQEGISYACNRFFPNRIKDSDFTRIPSTSTFKQGATPEQQAANLEPEEVHVQLASLDMVDQCENTANRVRAGQAAPEQPDTIGEVESLTLVGQFPAESFFNVYVEMDVDLNNDNQVDFTLFNPSATPLIFQGYVESFPLKVIYNNTVATDQAIPLYNQSSPLEGHVAWLRMMAMGFDRSLDCQNPFPPPTPDEETSPTAELLVKLATFETYLTQDKVFLSWRTAAERNSGGFYIWRANKDRQGDYINITRITQTLIPAVGQRGQGASYKYSDSTVSLGNTYYYALEEIELTGISHFYDKIASIAISQ